jgi:hypothetical protein
VGEQTGPVSWLEVPSAAFPGRQSQWQEKRRRIPSYSGGAAPVFHRTSGWPSLRESIVRESLGEQRFSGKMSDSYELWAMGYGLWAMGYWLLVNNP